MKPTDPFLAMSRRAMLSVFAALPALPILLPPARGAQAPDPGQ